MRRIVAAGAYAPRLRLPTDAIEDAWGSVEAPGVETKAVPEADEDAVTMAVEAGRRALAAGEVDPAAVEWLGFATTTPPVDEGDLLPRLGSILGIDPSGSATFGGSTRAGMQALATGLGVTGDDPVLAVAADCPRGDPDSPVDHAAGAGAAALLLEAAPTGNGTGDRDGDGKGASVIAHGESATVAPGLRFRRRGSETTEGVGVTAYERTASRRAVTDAVAALDAPVADVGALAIQAPDGRWPYRAGGGLAIDPDRIEAVETVSTVGDTGVASPLLGTARAFDRGLERTLIVGFGGGSGATALLISGTAPANTSLEGAMELDYTGYLRRRGIITTGAPEGGGAYVSIPTWIRSVPQRHRLVAGRCARCGELAFPPAGACPDCARDAGVEPVPLEGTGTVEAVTEIAQGGAPPEFVEQQSRSGSYASAIVAFEGPDGDTVSAPAQVTGLDATGVAIGDRVRAVVRRIYTQEGVTRYGFKVIPTAVAA